MVTEIEKTLTLSKRGRRMAFERDISSKIGIHRSIPPMMQVPSAFLRPNLISIWYLASDAIFRGRSLCVQQTLLYWSVMIWAPRRAGETLWVWETVVSRELASYDFFLVERSPAAHVMICGQYQESPYALRMFSVQVLLRPHPSAAWQLPEPSIWLSCTSNTFHGGSWPHPPNPVVSIRQGSSASAETSPSGNLAFWRLCPSPSRVHHLQSACPALYLLHCLPYHPHPPDCQNLHDPSDCLRSHSASPEMFIGAFW